MTGEEQPNGSYPHLHRSPSPIDVVTLNRDPFHIIADQYSISSLFVTGRLMLRVWTLQRSSNIEIQILGANSGDGQEYIVKKEKTETQGPLIHREKRTCSQ
jgi:hypothetical protein